jgi:hypothetical protein
LVVPAYREILRPLVEQLRRGRDARIFSNIEPEIEALSIQGVVWSNVERHWATKEHGNSDIRQHVKLFCLRGLGVSPKTIRAVVGEPRP